MGNLTDTARELRLLTFKEMANSGEAHFGGSLSMIEIVTALYFYAMNVDPKKPNKPDRDRLIVSKGHAGPAIYAALAMKGFFPVEHLSTLNQPGGVFSKHINRKAPGVELSTGSLGQGLSVAVGMALGMRAEKLPSYAYAILGDGECDEGQVWEAAMAAGSYKLDNLIVIVDRNYLQTDGATERIMPLEPFGEKWRAFGFNVMETDGHDVNALCKAIDEAKAFVGKPSVIIASTVKGKGISFMENNLNWHAAHITEREREQGLSELEKQHEL